MDQALDRQLAQPAEKPEVLDSDDDGVKGLADLLFEVGEQLDPDQLALGGLGPALGARAVLAQHDQLVMVAARLLPLEPGDQLAMDLQVGIAADRRGEVAVVLAGQGVVPLGLGGVAWPVSGCAAARSGRRIPRACRSSRLSTRWSSNRLWGWSRTRPRLRTNSANSVELERLGVGMRPPQEADFLLGQAGGDGLVGRQHEFLDDLVALVVDGQMSAGDLPMIAQLDLDFGKRELERAAAEPAAAQDHRQLEHLRPACRRSRARRRNEPPRAAFMTASACS